MFVGSSIATNCINVIHGFSVEAKMYCAIPGLSRYSGFITIKSMNRSEDFLILSSSNIVNYESRNPSYDSLKLLENEIYRKILNELKNGSKYLEFDEMDLSNVTLEEANEEA